jgi:DNA primase
VREWATRALQNMTLAANDRGYLLGRGARDELLEGMGVTTWGEPDEDAPDEVFREKYGPRGRFFKGRIIFPLWSPRGQLIGWDSRPADRKTLSRYIMPEHAWQTAWIGMPVAMPRIWTGMSVWVCEGVFDLFALDQALRGAPILATGTARLHRGQTEFLRRFAKDGVRLALDRDKAGRAGTEKAMMYLRRLGVECSDIPYGPGKDPGEIWDNHGLEGVERAFPFAA